MNKQGKVKLPLFLFEERCDHKHPEHLHLVPLSNHYNRSSAVVLGKGLFQTICSCVVCLIRRILEKLALAVEIDLTWSRGFVSVELGRLPNPLSCKTLLICPICISKVLIEAHWFLIAASVEARISLIMFEFSSCLLADSAINLVSDSSRFVLRSGYEEFPLFCW
ncbi:hypothetical protein Tco_0022463 [Tanacetum coccineum]